MSDVGINPGTVVKLKSGGPPMTVSELYDAEGGKAARCVWSVHPHEKVLVFDFMITVLEPANARGG